MRWFAVVLFFILLTPLFAHAQESPAIVEQKFYHAVVTGVTTENSGEESNGGTVNVELGLTDKPRRDTKVTALWSNDPTSRNFLVHKGDRVIVSCTILENEETCDIVSRDRSRALGAIFALFLATIWFISRKQGIKALLAMGLSIVIISAVIIPLILNGWSPFIVSLVGGLLILIPSIYITHGLTYKSHTALLAIGVASIIIVILAAFFTGQLQLMGMGSDESLYLNPSINLSGVLLSSILLGTLGVIDDLAFTQVSIVNELYHSNSKLSGRALFLRAMQVGHDHIASVINTLFLAYVGVALPLLILIQQNDIPIGIAIQQEALATEIMRTLIGTIGLLFVVPLATWLAARFILAHPSRFPALDHHHLH